jgi:mono/diheme cytochrome c family protein
MSQAVRVLCVLAAAAATALAGAACGTQRISVSTSQNSLRHGAVLFQQRCAGCHTLSYAATFGSAANVFTAQFNNGPNFNVRCERPVTRVLYAIANGGFSGAIMPQNIVIGHDADDVAKFVATYSGRQAPPLTGATPCRKKNIGSIPSASTSTTTSTTTTPKTTTTSGGKASNGGSGKATRHRSKK